jgi:hypothetical protein
MDYIVEYRHNGIPQKLVYQSYNDALRSARVLLKKFNLTAISHVQLSTPYGLKEYIKNHPGGSGRYTTENHGQEKSQEKSQPGQLN